jgi:hypothetical protein
VHDERAFEKQWVGENCAEDRQTSDDEHQREQSR